MVLKLYVQGRYLPALFENDVEMYGTQTSDPSDIDSVTFENDVEMYGTQTFADLNDIFL